MLAQMRWCAVTRDALKLYLGKNLSCSQCYIPLDLADSPNNRFWLSTIHAQAQTTYIVVQTEYASQVNAKTVASTTLPLHFSKWLDFALPYKVLVQCTNCDHIWHHTLCACVAINRNTRPHRHSLFQNAWPFNIFKGLGEGQQCRAMASSELDWTKKANGLMFQLKLNTLELQPAVHFHERSGWDDVEECIT